MQITISRNVLAEALAELAPLAGKNKVLPILNNIKFVTKGNRIRLQTSDGETTIRKYVESESIDQDGEFLADCASMNDFVGKTKGDTLNLILDDTTLTVKHAKGKAEFQTLTTDGFIEPNQDGDSVDIVIPAGMIISLVSVARNFVADDLLRPQMRPIRAIIENKKLTVCATDTRKMFVDSVTLEGDVPDVAWYIEPCIFSMLIKACKNQGSVVVKISDRNVSYRIGATTIFTQQTKGNYPDFKRAIPKLHKVEVKCDKSDLADTLSRSTLFVEESNLIRVSIDNTEMEISADNVSKLQKMTEKVTCESDAELTIGANVKMFAECVKACTSNDVLIELQDASRPIVFKDSANPNRVILCMPMSIVNPQ